ncbi:hypothetical protein ACW0JT_08545 [Arthrobacter sp. SA17]
MSRSEVLLRRALAAAALTALTAGSITACASAVSIENADVPAWKATALPSATGAVLEDSGKILDRQALRQEAADVQAGVYTLTMTCEGGGKAFSPSPSRAGKSSTPGLPATEASSGPRSLSLKQGLCRSAHPAWMHP